MVFAVQDGIYLGANSLPKQPGSYFLQSSLKYSNYFIKAYCIYAVTV
jgi:hypothetical protein